MKLQAVHQQSKYNSWHCNWTDSSEGAFSLHLVVKIHLPSCIKNLKMA